MGKTIHWYEHRTNEKWKKMFWKIFFQGNISHSFPKSSGETWENLEMPTYHTTKIFSDNLLPMQIKKTQTQI